MKELIITTAFDIPGKKVLKVLGIARGNTVRARNIGREVKTYTDMTSQSRDEAFNRMVNSAVKMEADAIIGMRFMTSMVMQGASEMLAYGTAVKLK